MPGSRSRPRRSHVSAIPDGSFDTLPLLERFEQAWLETTPPDIAVFVCSMCGDPAIVSETDRRQALVGGEPAYPQAVYVVASVVAGALDEMKAFQWNGRSFVEIPHE